MPETFEYDVFLSHASADKAAVRELAERLNGDGLRVWLDEWVIPQVSSPSHRLFRFERWGKKSGLPVIWQIRQ